MPIFTATQKSAGRIERRFFVTVLVDRKRNHRCSLTSSITIELSLSVR